MMLSHYGCTVSNYRSMIELRILKEANVSGCGLSQNQLQCTEEIHEEPQTRPAGLWPQI